MRAILYHFPATEPEPALGVEWHRDRMVYRQGDPINSEWIKDTLVGATLRIRPVRLADEQYPTCGGFRLLDLDDETAASLGARILNQLTAMREAGAPYGTVVLSLDPPVRA